MQTKLHFCENPLITSNVSFNVSQSKAYSLPEQSAIHRVTDVGYRKEESKWMLEKKIPATKNSLNIKPIIQRGSGLSFHFDQGVAGKPFVRDPLIWISQYINGPFQLYYSIKQKRKYLLQFVCMPK